MADKDMTKDAVGLPPLQPDPRKDPRPLRYASAADVTNLYTGSRHDSMTAEERVGRNGAPLYR